MADEEVVLETGTPEAPAPQTEAVATPSEPEMYELPDGTKVDGQTLHQKYVKDLLPAFTRKTMELAELKKAQPPAPEPAWKQEGWQAKSDQELMAASAERAKMEILADLQRETEEEQEQQRLIDERLSAELAELKQTDPSVNEHKVIAHAAKFKFPSLIDAHANLKYVEKLEKLAEERVLKNVQQRAADPVSSKSAPSSPAAIPIIGSTLKEKAQNALRSLNT